MSDGPLLWYVNRGTGVVLLALLTAVTVLGILARRTRAGGRLPGFVVPALHRNCALIAVALLLAHVATAVADEYVDIRWWQAIVPWALSYRPLWLGLGTVASDLVALVVLTSAVRTRIGHRTWRAVHWTSYAAWGLGVVHGLGTGTDGGESWARWAYIASIAGVALAFALTLGLRKAGRRRRTQRSPVAR